MTFEEAARAHANSRDSTGTRTLYNKDLDTWLEHCEEHNISPTKPTLAAAVAYRDKIAKRCEPATVRRVISALSSMYRKARDEEGKPIASWNPFADLPRPKASDYGKTEAVADDVAEAVFSATKTLGGFLGTRDLAIFLLMYETGQRVSSVAMLKRTNILEREGTIVLRVKIKGGKPADIPIPKRATIALKAWLEISLHGQFVFTDENGKPVSPKAVNKRLDFYTKSAGIKHVAPHQFRAAYITTALDAGVPLYEVQRAVQHKDPKTTQRYDRSVRGEGVSDVVAEYRAKIEGK